MWPFGRSRRRSASPSDTIVQASAEPAVDGWAGVPPLQRSLAPIDRTAEYDSFGDALSSWQAPPLAIAPLGHELSADAASGVVADIAAPAARPAPMPAEPPSRRAAPPVSVQRSRASGDPDLALATRLGTSGSEPAWRSVWSGRPPDPALGRVTVRSGDATTSDAAAFEGVHSPGVAPVEPSLRETGHTASSPEPSRGPMTTAPGPGLPLMHLAAVQRSAADAFEIDLADAADVSTAS